VNVSQGGKYLDVTFFTWLAFNLPAMMLNVFIAWIYLVYYYDGIKDWGKVPIIGIFVSLWKKKKPTEEDPQEEHLRRWKSHAVGSLLRAEYKKLGPINFHEVAVGVVFVGVVLLWILRDPDVFSGWSTLFKGASVGDSTGAMFGVLLLFIIPKDFSFLSAGKFLE
jgi:di/tricarboxylate transporter